MFPFEGLMLWIARKVTNRRFPEATVMETYRVSIFILNYFMPVSISVLRPPDASSTTSRLKTNADYEMQTLIIPYILVLYRYLNGVNTWRPPVGCLWISSILQAQIQSITMVIVMVCR